MARLPRVVPATEGKPIRPETADNQRLMARIAGDPSEWTSELAGFTADVFDAMAPTWDDERSAYRPAPLRDALSRGGPFPPGRCLEVGSGTGVLTPLLAEVWPDIVSVDLSMAMLRLSRHGPRVRGDASSLPLAGHTFAAVVVGDGPLFAAELVRLMADAAVVVWSNALGADAPYYLPTAAILSAFAQASPARGWSAIESEAGWGSWVVIRGS